MMAAKEIVLYVNQPFKKFRWVGLVSVAQFGFVMFSMVVMPSHRLVEERRAALASVVRRRKLEPEERVFKPGELPVDEVFEPNPEYDSATFWERIARLNYGEIFSPHNIQENVSGRPYLTLGLLGASVAIAFGFNMYVRRMAHVITLLPGQRIRFESFSAFGFGKPPTIELHARDIAATPTWPTCSCTVA